LALDLWVESIPYEETRRYTRRVLQSFGVYSWLAQQSLPELTFDLPSERPTTDEDGNERDDVADDDVTDDDGAEGDANTDIAGSARGELRPLPVDGTLSTESAVVADANPDGDGPAVTSAQ